MNSDRCKSGRKKTQDAQKNQNAIFCVFLCLFVAKSLALYFFAAKLSAYQDDYGIGHVNSSD